MAAKHEIGLAYLQDHPREAARVLEDLPADSVAALFNAVPARVCVPVVQQMHPAIAARALAQSGDERKTALLGSIGYQAAASVLRHVDEVRRAALLERLPTARALIIRALLAYPQDTVGAWTNPQVVSVTGDISAATALARLRATGDHCPGRLFVTGAEHQLLGQVELVDLLRAEPNVPLDRLVVACDHSLPARAPLHSVVEHAAWRTQSALPVVERGQRFAGVLEIGVLTGAMQHGLSTPDAQAQEDIVASVGAGYWNVTAGILESLVALLPAGAPVYGPAPEVDREH